MRPLSFDRVHEALQHIPADQPREDWVRVAMALKSGIGEDGFNLFDTWSQGGQTYNAGDVQATWRSVKPEGGVGLGTLVRMAKSHGFKGSLRDNGPRTGPGHSRIVHQTEPALAERAASASHNAAAASAASIWEQANDGAPCAYLDRKGVKAYGVRVDKDGRLVVPLRDAAGVLWNVQRIAPEKQPGKPDKLFLPGGRKSGLWHWCGNPNGAAVLLIADGYATAASLNEATGWPAAVAFDAGNLRSVASGVRQGHPGATIILCADDDASTAAMTSHNTGREKATAAAAAVGGLVALPLGLPADGTDFNDLAAHAGLAAVRQCVTAAIDRAHAVDPNDRAHDDQRNVTAARPVTEVPDITCSVPVTGTDPFTLDES